ncbi:MAG TPA: T9SS type A sorting domain-containing protein [Flavobacteriales bacterium]|nr:T9SS type A sorting domain-containing protein [Flavobacteriales bacterium]
MRKALFILIALFFRQNGFSQTIITIADGNFSDSAIWNCGCAPLPTHNLVISHNLILDTDYSSMGYITVNAGATLVGDSSRTINSSGGISVTGLLEAGTFNLLDSTFLNTGTIHIYDTFYVALNSTYTMNSAWALGGSYAYNTGTINLTGGGGIYAHKMHNHGNIYNASGGSAFGCLFNFSTFINDGVFNVADTIYNKGIFTTNTEISFGTIFNGDASTSATFINNHNITVYHNLVNYQTMDGSGAYCIAENSSNFGSVNGTLNICDATGLGFDVNTGTIAGTVSFCSSPCTWFLNTEEIQSTAISVFPNPFSNVIHFQTEVENNYSITILNSLNETILQTNFTGNSYTLDSSLLPGGIYFYCLSDNMTTINGVLVK